MIVDHSKRLIIKRCKKKIDLAVYMYKLINVHCISEGNMNKEKTIKRLIIEVPADTHKVIKLKATERNISIRAWVSRAIVEQLKKEKQYESQ